MLLPWPPRSPDHRPDRQVRSTSELGDSPLKRDLERVRQLAAALSWSDPLGQELLDLARGSSTRLELPSLRLVEPADQLAALAA
jgi:hypothetical protein